MALFADEEDAVEMFAVYEIIDQATTPDEAARRCTDTPCLIVFLIALVPWILLYGYGAQNGSLSWYYGLVDATGQVCGVSPGVQSLPYLYFCKDSTGQVRRENSICVDQCRNVTAGTYYCPETESSPVYPTVPLGGLLCVPTGADQYTAAQVGQFTGSYGLLDHVNFLRWATELGVIVRAWPPILLAAMAAVCFSSLYMCFVDKCAGTIVMFGTGMAILMTFVISFQMLCDGLKGNGHDHIPSSGDARLDSFLAIVVGLFGVLLACMLCGSVDSVRRAGPSIKAAAAFIREVPVMYLDPLVNLCIRVALTWTFVVGFLQLLSIYIKEGGPTAYMQAALPWYLAFYVFMCAWMLWIVTAIGEFAAAYVAQEWFYNAQEGGKIPGGAPLRAMGIGVWYHTGTFAMGSFAVLALGGLRDLSDTLAASARQNDNVCSKCIFQCCCCFVWLSDRYLKYFTRLAYIDVAINSNSYCQAAHQSVMIVEKSGNELVALQGALYVCTACGLVSTAVLGAFVCHVVVWFNPMYSDPSSESFVQDPLLLDLAAAAVSLVVAMPFYTVFDTSSDTFVFCHALEEMRHKSWFSTLKDDVVSLTMGGGDKDKRNCTERSCDYSGNYKKLPKETKRAPQTPGKPERPMHAALAALIDPKATQTRLEKRMRFERRQDATDSECCWGMFAKTTKSETTVAGSMFGGSSSSSRALGMGFQGEGH